MATGSVRHGEAFVLIAFFVGMGIITLIDLLIPEYENPHEASGLSLNTKTAAVGMLEQTGNEKALHRLGLMSALAIAIHNFPEGLATFISGMQEPTLAIPIAVAIAIHNIPEGIAVSIPVFFSTGSKKKAFVYSFLSGLSEPLGAVVGFTLLRTFVNDLTFGVVFSMVAGIMVFISLDELLPSAREYGEALLSIYGLISGMMVMAVSLLLFM